MADPTIQGVNVVWGIPTARNYGTGFTTTGATFKHGAEKKLIKNKDGESTTRVIFDRVSSLDLDVYPSGATPGVLPEIGDVVAVNAVNYKFMDGEEVSTAEGEQKMRFSLERRGAID